MRSSIPKSIYWTYSRVPEKIHDLEVSSTIDGGYSPGRYCVSSQSDDMLARLVPQFWEPAQFQWGSG